MEWLELSVLADSEAVESVAEVFSRLVHGGVAIEEDITAFSDREGYVVNVDKPVIIRGYLPVDGDCGCAVTRVREALGWLGMMRPVGELSIRTVHEEDWANAWKEHFQVHRVGRRVVIVPSWRQHEPLPDDVVITLDPGMAFGTGLHPTTRLCLALLEDLVRPGDNVLDLGAGSGILAIAAARLGAASVTALDTDSVAVEVARANVAANGVQDVVTVGLGSLGSKPRPDAPVYNLVAANIIARVLCDLAAPLSLALAPGGLLIASGIIREREDEVAAAFSAAGLTLRERHTEGDWVAVVCGRSESSTA